MSLGLIKSLTKTSILILALAILMVFFLTPFTNLVHAIHHGYYEYGEENINEDNYATVQDVNLYSEGKRFLNSILDTGYLLADSIGFTDGYNNNHGTEFSLPYYTYIANDMASCTYTLTFLAEEEPKGNNAEGEYDIIPWKTEEHRQNIKWYIENISHYAYSPDDIMYSGAYTYEEIGVTFDEWQSLPTIRKWLLLYNQPDYIDFYQRCKFGASHTPNFEEGELSKSLLDYILEWFK